MLNYKHASLMLSIIVFILLLVTQLSPGWIIFSEYSVQPISPGVWTFCLDGKCSFLSSGKVSLVIIRGFMFNAICSCFLAILCSVDWTNCLDSSKVIILEGPIAAAFTFFTCFSMLGALLVFHFTSYLPLEKEVEKLSERWMFFLTCINCGLCFLTGLFKLAIYGFRLQRRRLHRKRMFPV